MSTSLPFPAAKEVVRDTQVVEYLSDGLVDEVLDGLRHVVE